ncbi:hypothetical protein Pla52o_34530 [Novipirellula galeiformis]|uniref:Uncharacterized protein n=1 Tax=Novipirellula galeiformis TaxID=2528004 RepID=A0A5C6CF82_9BACT|nr:hypothetical protein [Novipirellula galeiformis]TWU22397.1 hypothetical protein Pla52o_34530 [Novipirellula galeiformis]
MRLIKSIPLILGGLLVFGIYGCNTPSADSVTPPATETSEMGDDHVGHEHEDHDHAADDPTIDTNSPMAKMMPGLNELSAEDYKSAMAQHICPVTGKMLGTMGAPEKVDVNGNSVWICCDGCKDKLLADPEKYLAKLKQ